jgi:hypothetical protein
MYKIVSVSRNTRLLMQRNDTLALAGFRVISPRVPEQAPYLAFEQRVDALIIGHSVEPHMRETIVEMLRRLCPHCLIVFAYVGERQSEPLADVSLDVTNGNEPVINFLQDRLPRQQHAAD